MVIVQAAWQPSTGHAASRDMVWPSCFFQENIPETSGLNLNKEGEPTPEEAACKRQRVSHHLFVSWAIILYFQECLDCGTFTQRDQRRREHEEYNNLFCTCHFNIRLLPLWHSTRVFETQ